MSVPAWVIRPARNTKRDRALLASFRCADPSVDWQVDVESFVRETLFDWAFDPLAKAQDPRLLLIFERKSKRLVGLAAHERTSMTRQEGAPFAATKLEVIAVALEWQGRKFASGERASDVVMSAALTDVVARVPPRHARVFAVVHEENVRSIALCQRHGLLEELSRPDALRRYRRLVTAHVPSGRALS
jgi:hypothetical protein